MQPFEHDSFDGHEHISYVNDEATGLHAIIAIHSTALGPAAGGCRMLPYENTGAALYDVLRLSKGMSYKNAVAGLPLGGGKSVIIGDPKTDKTPALLEAFGRAIERLGGAYWTAEDMNIGTDDMANIARATSFAAGLEHGKAASGNPSPVTAQGVFEGIKLAVNHRHGSESLAGITVAVQGIGNVGYALCEMLHSSGAYLVVTDTNQNALNHARENLGAQIVDLDNIYTSDVDIFSPCAMGAVINRETIPKLKASIVAGAANNQLATPDCGNLLYDRGILYAPDYVINGGGIINVATEILGITDSHWVPDKINSLMETLDHIFHRSKQESLPSDIIADMVARERLNGAHNAHEQSA